MVRKRLIGTRSKGRSKGAEDVVKHAPVWVYVVHCKEADDMLSAYVFAEDLPAQSWAERLMAEEQVVGVNVQRMRVMDAVPEREAAH